MGRNLEEPLMILYDIGTIVNTWELCSARRKARDLILVIRAYKAI
jgi:hypothetical protein